ncbi:RING finger protein 208 isoform X1 [Ahaetulla prasina]|uniref:RING finger protein 208 isoform X1 n=1 Tax=Ahaetulla prasina TaxID=499056 RepID=UPI0026499319|nr:RING finger protein 208 isoform X1 [Ahaetulla prasina]
MTSAPAEQQWMEAPRAAWGLLLLLLQGVFLSFGLLSISAQPNCSGLEAPWPLLCPLGSRATYPACLSFQAARGGPPGSRKEAAATATAAASKGNFATAGRPDDEGGAEASEPLFPARPADRSFSAARLAGAGGRAGAKAAQPARSGRRRLLIEGNVSRASGAACITAVLSLRKERGTERGGGRGHPAAAGQAGRFPDRPEAKGPVAFGPRHPRAEPAHLRPSALPERRQSHHRRGLSWVPVAAGHSLASRSAARKPRAGRSPSTPSRLRGASAEPEDPSSAPRAPAPRPNRWSGAQLAEEAAAEYARGSRTAGRELPEGSEGPSQFQVKKGQLLQSKPSAWHLSRICPTWGPFPGT